MIIDVHTHIYPGKIAEKASVAIGNFYSIPMNYDGTPEHLLQEGQKAGIDKFLVHSVATTPAQVESINRFIISEVYAHPDRFPLRAKRRRTEMSIKNSTRSGRKDVFHAFLVKNATYDTELDIPCVKPENCM